MQLGCSTKSNGTVFRQNFINLSDLCANWLFITLKFGKGFLLASATSYRITLQNLWIVSLEKMRPQLQRTWADTIKETTYRPRKKQNSAAVARPAHHPKYACTMHTNAMEIMKCSDMLAFGNKSSGMQETPAKRSGTNTHTLAHTKMS